MNNRLSDEQIDNIVAQIVKDFSIDDSVLDEIADSPQLWWNVRKNVATAAIPAKKGLLGGLGWLIPAFGILAIGICFGAAIWMFSAERDSAVAEILQPVQTESTDTPLPVFPPLPLAKQSETPANEKEIGPVKKRTEISVVTKIRTSRQLRNPARAKSEAATAESKTDFIALSYAGNSEGGQVVRVKVPSAMMVTLGVVSEVEKDAAMVSAEVVVGDDGLARAIRFIR